jgi:hypothetical protein
MKLAIAKLKSTTPYSQSKYYSVEKEAKELAVDYEARTWRERCHVNDKGQVFIPPMAFANSLKEAAKYLSVSIPGKGKSTYTKHFISGVLVTEPVYLPLQKEDVKGEWVFVPSDGQRGGGKRVEKCFPLIQEWSGTVNYYILDDIITEDIFRQVLESSGSLIGIGRFRPHNMGYYGRFEVIGLQFGNV